jgi:hypothetical protein
MLDEKSMWYERAVLLERCSLNEALLWVWCGRVPVHSIGRDLDGNSLSQLSDWECEVLGIPPVPDGASRSPHRFTKDYLVKKYERLRREARKYRVDEGLCQSVEVRKWLELVERAIEEPAAEIFLALRQGRLTASGKLLPSDAPIIEFISDYHSYGASSRLDDLPNQEIAKNTWSANGIDWLSNALTASHGCYCDISLEVAALLRFFPANGSPAPKAEFVGAFGDFLARATRYIYRLLDSLEAMTSEYLAKPLTPLPLPTRDGWMLRTIGDAGTYILSLPQNRKGFPTGNRSVKPAQLR